MEEKKGLSVSVRSFVTAIIVILVLMIIFPGIATFIPNMMVA